MDKNSSSAKSFSIGQKALILNPDGQVLIIKRDKSNTKAELWDFPGGRIEWGESLREGLVREVKEEANLDISVISTPLAITTFFREIDRNNQIIRLIYLCKTKSSAVLLSDEHSSFKWINPKEYPSYTFLDKDYDKSFIKLIEIIANQEPIREFLDEGMLSESIDWKRSQSFE